MTDILLVLIWVQTVCKGCQYGESVRKESARKELSPGFFKHGSIVVPFRSFILFLSFPAQETQKYGGTDKHLEEVLVALGCERSCCSRQVKFMI